MSTRSQNLENISNQELERRKIPRIGLCQEQVRIIPQGKVYAIDNLSFEGLAIRVLESSDLILFTVGSRLKAQLNLRGHRFEAEIFVKHCRADLIGCEFIQLGEKEASLLKEFLDPARLAQDLKALPINHGSALWFHGPLGTDLMVWPLPAEAGKSKKGFERMTLYIYGDFIHWDPEKKIQTGKAFASEEKSDQTGAFRYETMLLKYDAKVDGRKLDIAKSFVLGSNLSQELKDWLVSKL